MFCWPSPWQRKIPPTRRDIFMNIVTVNGSSLCLCVHLSLVSSRHVCVCLTALTAADSNLSVNLCGQTHTRRHTHSHTQRHTHADSLTHTHTHTHKHTHLCRYTYTHRHTRKHTCLFLGLRGLSIGVMVFILYNLYVLLPYTYPTPKLSPHRRLCASLDFQKNTI